MKEKISVSEMIYKEKLKYKTIIKIINGKLDKKKAAIIIGCSERRINQLINIFLFKLKCSILTYVVSSILLSVIAI